MKKFFLIICLVYLLSLNISGQDKPTAEEEHAAKILATSFFNRFQETQDLAPLIEEFFVKDFARRLKFCRRTGECGGENRDFWKKRIDFVAFKATETDYLRTYIFSINDAFLTCRLINYLKDKNQNNNQSEEIAAKAVIKEIKSLLGKKKELFKFGLLGDLGRDDSDDFFISNFKTLIELRRFLYGYEKYLIELRNLEATLKKDFQKRKEKVSGIFSHIDFRVHTENNRYGFFDYPPGTKMLQVWDEGDSVMFVTDLIEEEGQLKIVAIYPPMD